MNIILYSDIALNFTSVQATNEWIKIRSVEMDICSLITKYLPTNHRITTIGIITMIKSDIYQMNNETCNCFLSSFHSTRFEVTYNEK